LLTCNDGPAPTPILIGNQALRFEEYKIHPKRYFYTLKNPFMTMIANFEFLILGTRPVTDPKFNKLNDSAQLFIVLHTINYQVRDYFGLSCSRYIDYKGDTTERRVKLSVTWRRDGLSDYDIAKMLRDLGNAGVVIGSTSAVESADGHIIDGWPFRFEIEDVQKSSSELQTRTDAVKSSLARLPMRSLPKSDRPRTPGRGRQVAKSDTPKRSASRKRGDRKPVESAPATQLKINSSRNWNAPIELPATEEIMDQDELTELRLNISRLNSRNKALEEQNKSLESIRTMLDYREVGDAENYAYIQKLIDDDQKRSNDRSGSSDTIIFEASDFVDSARDNKIEGLKQQIHDLERNALDFNKSLAAKDAEIYNLKVDGEQYDKEFLEKDSEISDLTKTVAAKDSEISDLTKTVAAKDSEISDLKKELERYDNEISELKQSVKDKDFEIESLKKAVAARDSEIAEIIRTSGQAVDKKELEISELKQTVSELKQTASELKQTVSELTEQVSEYVQIASDKDDEIACLSNEIHERDDNICRLQAELDDATHATTKAEAEKASERIRVLELEKELEDAKNEASDSEGLSLEELEELKKTLCDGIETTFEKFRQARE
jgi:predicted RNase H-like nuclease (RuvC/YqgF family)